MKGGIALSWTNGTFRVARLFWGLFLYALGIVFTICANVGLAPWEVFHQGLAMHLGITMGAASVIASAALVVLALAMREHVGFGTLCNMLAIGGFIDLILLVGWIPEMTAFVPGVAMLLVGLFTIAFASYFYMGAGYGAGPRDSLMVVLSKRTGRSAGFCRGCVELTVLALGWWLGGRVGVGTVVSALGMGVAVQIVFSLLRFNVRTVRQESFAETWRRGRG